MLQLLVEGLNASINESYNIFLSPGFLKVYCAEIMT